MATREENLGMIRDHLRMMKDGVEHYQQLANAAQLPLASDVAISILEAMGGRICDAIRENTSDAMSSLRVSQ